MSPRPMTTTRSPSAVSARRTPCSAIAPTVVNAASRSGTPVGHRRDEVAGHRHDLGVVGVARAGARHALADAEVGDPARCASTTPALE